LYYTPIYLREKNPQKVISDQITLGIRNLKAREGFDDSKEPRYNIQE
jgi:hypothetical protein